MEINKTVELIEAAKAVLEERIQELEEERNDLLDQKEAMDECIAVVLRLGQSRKISKKGAE